MPELILLTLDRAYFLELHKAALDGDPTAKAAIASLWSDYDDRELACFLCDDPVDRPIFAQVLPENAADKLLAAPLCANCRSLPNMVRLSRCFRVLKKMHHARTGKYATFSATARVYPMHGDDHDYLPAARDVGRDVVAADLGAVRSSSLTTPSEWLITATHEAGHIIAYLNYDLPFGTIRIWQADNGKVKGSVVSPAGNYDCIARAACCLAGPLSEERLTGIPYDEQPGSANDIAMAREALRRLGSTNVAVLIPLVRALVATNQPTIEFITGLLLQSGQLEYEQILRLGKKELIRRGLGW